MEATLERTKSKPSVVVKTQKKTASQAIEKLKPEAWSATDILSRLRLLKAVRENLKLYGEDLARCDAAMKNSVMGEPIVGNIESELGTIFPIATTLSACIELYESMQKGKMLKPISINNVSNSTQSRHDLLVFPQTIKDKVIYSDRQDYLRVKGEPRQVNPMSKAPGIVVVLGAGNYSSALEIVKAMFLENCAVVHKPHPLNEATDAIWEKIFAPLVQVGAIAFCAADQGSALVADRRVSKIYFTGGSATARSILESTKTQTISECGGNSPCIIVPGDRPWSDNEIAHQARQIVTMGKINGGAICARPQTIITSKHWPQRQQFLQQLEKAIAHDTPASGTYYPGSDKVKMAFLEKYPTAKVIHPENGKYQHGDVVLITDVAEDSYALSHEAFCQIFNEVALDVAANAEEFLPVAVDFANDKLLGTLCSCILIDEDTKKSHRDALEQAITNLEYGGIAINTMTVFIFLNPYLTWGGNEEGKTLVSGNGNFGNLLCYENVEKSIIHGKFVSPGHMINTSKAAFNTLAKNMANYSIEPSWINLIKLLAGVVLGAFKKKDF